MKKFFVLLFFWFLSCSNDGFESQIAADSAKEDFCRIIKDSDTTCYMKISTKLCKELGGEPKMCPPTVSSSSSDDISSSSGNAVSSSSSKAGSSSSGNTVSSSSGKVSSSSSGIGGSSSSDDEEGSSSSDDDDSSSSIGSLSSSGGSPVPILSGNFEFRLFDYSSSSSKIYFLQKSMHVSNTPAPAGTSQLYNSLLITNSTEAKCEAITVEITGGGLTAIDSEPNHNYTKTPGIITAKAVATCNGTRTELRTATAEVVANPTLGPCPSKMLPSTYVAKTKGEYVKGSVPINDNYGRCEVKYLVGTTGTADADSIHFSTTGQQNSLSVSVSISCASGTTITPLGTSCPLGDLFVADNYIKFDHNDDPKYLISKNSSTVIDISTTEFPNGLGCEYNSSSATSISFSYNGTTCAKNQSYWTDCTFNPNIYTENGNRILFRTTLTQDLLCTTFTR